MNDIFKGPVYDFLVNKSINNKGDWGGNGGTLDASTPQNLENSKKGNAFMREFLQSISPQNIITSMIVLNKMVISHWVQKMRKVHP